MRIATRTPDGEYSRCSVCRRLIHLEPSWPPGDAPCPNCGSLVWFDTAPIQGVKATEAISQRPSSIEEAEAIWQLRNLDRVVIPQVTGVEFDSLGWRVGDRTGMASTMVRSGELVDLPIREVHQLLGDANVECGWWVWLYQLAENHAGLWLRLTFDGNARVMEAVLVERAAPPIPELQETAIT